jgi:PadR family transcriptional regulator
MGLTAGGQYVVLLYMAITPDTELKKGNAELLILALLEEKARHGYEIGKLIAERSEGVLRFHVASLYPLLYRLERRGWVKGEWEPAGGRRRRYYRLTPGGRKILAQQRTRWRAFSGAVDRIVDAGAAHRSAVKRILEAQYA